MLTGEAKLQRRGPKDVVYAGTLNTNGLLVMVVTKTPGMLLAPSSSYCSSSTTTSSSSCSSCSSSPCPTCSCSCSSLSPSSSIFFV
jgi:hypothetical protein